MSKYMAFVEDEIHNRRKAYSRFPKLQSALEDNTQHVHAILDYAMNMPQDNDYCASLERITGIMMWFDRPQAWEHLLNKIQHRLNTMPEHLRRKTAIEYANFIQIPVYQTAAFVRWLKNNNIELTDMAWRKNIGSRDPLSIHALLKDFPDETLAWIQKHKIDMYQLLDSPWHHEDPQYVKKILDRISTIIDPDVLSQSLRCFERNLQLDLESMLIIHIVCTYSLDPDNPQAWPVESEHQRTKWKILQDYILYDQLHPEIEELSKDKQTEIKQLAYWLHPDRVTPPHQPRTNWLDIQSFEKACINPEIESMEHLYQRAYYQKNPQEMVRFLPALDQVSANPATHNKHYSWTMNNFFEASTSTHPQWNDVLLQSVQKGSSDPAAQWFCATYMHGASWSALQEQARIIATLDVEKEIDAIWRMAYTTLMGERHLQHAIDSSEMFALD